ncbi:hypothetical protein NEMBOFW57_000702 [Staphylotrichum longicolle]|uniref:Uncharacterized protein n=1 Tax=Staphylotrichum longicolle TaxID=669026 RepID=A0AAD4F063_9PEZI|nr:hypothetical protein NEMBOFW57_000702 [Staphylotrichum longicolle]
MISSFLAHSRSSHLKAQGSSEGKPSSPSEGTQGTKPPSDTWNNRHAVLYFTSPDLPDFYETVHTQRDSKTLRWIVGRHHAKIEWVAEPTYVDHVNAGAVLVDPGQEMVPVDIVAANSGHDRDMDWNCHNFVYEGLQELVRRGYQTQEWYDFVENEMMDKLLDGTVD